MPAKRTKYEYKTLPVSVVFELTSALPYFSEDAYIAADQESQAYAQLLEDGFRWIGSDNDFAIFEKVHCDNTVEVPQE